MAEKKKGVISAEDWDSGSAPASSSAKAQAVLDCLKDVGRGGMNSGGIEEATGIKWLYGTINKLWEEGKLEKKKIGRGNYYRLPEEKAE